MSLGPSEILVCLLVALIVLGPDKLPKAARQMGNAIREFKKFSSAMQSQVSNMLDADLEASEEAPTEAAKPMNPDLENFKPIDDHVSTTPVLDPDSPVAPTPPEDPK